MRMRIFNFKFDRVVGVCFEHKVVKLLIVEPVDFNVGDVFTREKLKMGFEGGVFILPAICIDVLIGVFFFWVIFCENDFTEGGLIVFVSSDPSLIKL